jgi:hypothetical protein
MDPSGIDLEVVGGTDRSGLEPGVEDAEVESETDSDDPEAEVDDSVEPSGPDLDDEGRWRSWIASGVARGGLPIYRLQFPEIDPDYAIPRRVGPFGPSTSRRHDSGVLEFWWPRHLEIAPLGQFLVDRAVQEDSRILVPLPETRSEVIAAEWESRIAELGLPVIGPGGRILIAHEATGTTAEAVIRKRGETVFSRLRSTDDLIASLSRRIAQHPDGSASIVEAAFGYFELSKYERQDWLRPVFMVSIEITIPGDERIRWVETIVEPATEADGLGPAEGLGSWFG